MPQIHHLPLADIDATALLRDRLALDAAALGTLQASILRDGLRQPIEVFAQPDTQPGTLPFALISGLRRLTAFQRLHAQNPADNPTTNPGRFATIPAFIRAPQDTAQALALMVAENEIRAPITPWEKGALLQHCLDARHFETLDAATETLFPDLTRQGHSRLRGFALVFAELEGVLTDPERLSARRMDRLAVALRAGLGELLHLTLADHRGAGPETQWRALEPVITEALLLPEAPPPEAPPNTPRKPGRPRRALHLRSGITLRREWTRNGWIIRINARHSEHPEIVDDILDLVERWFQGE
ncbi:ParB/RepB/Spo0J family partition protein [Pararhodobacter oceanensis]|uniref:ParB-like N-terminal domain-containing protein n=1 Tax=Pararhodobacter oceanensis TaxID=2172121 RepID=A0A2T8HS90_9RHOB|nr:ParB N-terminal domain-containing protein [Pararhodobacter oceanensis]PVH28304.1 hypothetical protein DDE20_11995 [Pararhodobacter oceanensis]